MLLPLGGSAVAADLGSRLNLDPGERLAGDAAEKGLAAQRARGGSCVTGEGAVLECPKSGGPSCGSEKVAACRCIETTAKTWTAISACVEPSLERPEGASGPPSKGAKASDPRKRVAFAGCNGGTCNTSSGLQLSCPTSGGPGCDGEEVCLCGCTQRSNGGWSTSNACVLVSDL